MSFDQSIVLECILCPAGIVVAAWMLARRFDSIRDSQRRFAVTVGWWLAVTSAMSIRHGWQWWPEEAWRQALLPLLAWTLLPVFSDDRRSERWIVAGVLACATAYIAIPGGDQWSDTFHLHRFWMFAVATSCLVSSVSIDSIAGSGGERWCLWIALAGLAGPLALAAATYGSLAEWTLAVVVATLVAACLATAGDIHLWRCGYGVLAAAAGITAAGRFYGYEDHPAWVYLVILYGPALIGAIDAPIRRRPTWQRVTTSGVLSVAMVGSVTWAVLLR